MRESPAVTHHPELPYWLALRRAGLGSTNFALLLARFSTIEAAWGAPSGAVAGAGIDPQYVRAMAKAQASFDPDHELRLLEQYQARALTWLDVDYPANLREIPQSPPVIFVRGTAGPQFEQAVAVVGTRHVTPYGRQAAEHFCEALAKAGVPSSAGSRGRGCHRPPRGARTRRPPSRRWPEVSTRCTRGRMPGWQSASWHRAVS